MKVPNNVLKTVLALAELNKAPNCPASLDPKDVQALITWANEGISKRAAMASAPRSTNVAD